MISRSLIEEVITKVFGDCWLVHLYIIVTTLSNDTSNEITKENYIPLLTNVIAFVITIEKFIALLTNVIAFVITKVK